MKYEWILFDLDNTIYDFDAASHYALLHTFDAFGIPSDEKHRALYYTINHQCWMDFENGKLDVETLRYLRFELFIKKINATVDPIQMGRRYLHLLAEADFKIDGAMDLLDTLKPNYQLAVVTNGLQEVKRPQLSKPEIAQYFEAIIISEEIGVAKPQAGFFDFTFNAIGQPDKSKVIIVGDNLNSDIRGGEDYGIDTCWFNPKAKENSTGIIPTFEIQYLADFLKLL